MIFKLHSNWVRDKYGIPESDSVRFNMMQRVLNLGSFLVETETAHEEVGENNIITEQFFIATPEDTLEFISVNKFESVNIAYLSRRSDNEGSYSVSDVIKIFSAQDKDDRYAHIIECKDKRSYIVSCFVDSIEELKNIELIYFDSNQDR